MRRARLVLISVVLVAFASLSWLLGGAEDAQAVCSGTIAFGDVFDCTLSTNGEVDTFTFSGTSGERILFRMASGAVYPRIIVKRPNATQLCTTAGYPAGQMECTLDATGTFSIEAKSEVSFWTGGYALHIARTSAPTTETPTSMAYGDVVDGTWNRMRWSAYSLSGTTGEKLVVRLKWVSGTYTSQMLFVLRNPSGGDVCGGAAIDEAIAECTLTATGTHILWVATADAGTGTYKLHVGRISVPSSQAPTATSYGTVSTGTISALKWYPYTFTGTTGDRVGVRMAAANGNLSAFLRLRRPDGSELCFNGTPYDATLSCVLDATGTWTIWASGEGGESGDYSLFLTRMAPTSSETVTNISYGSLSNVTVSAMRWYPFAFSGTSGERALIHVRHAGAGSNTPAIILMSPTGVVYGADGSGGGVCSAVQNAYDLAAECALNATGTWTFWVYYDTFKDTAGSAQVYLARMTPTTTVPTVPLQVGYQYSTTTSAMLWYPHSLTGAQGDLVRLKYTNSGASHGLQFSLRRPDFSEICRGNGGATQEKECTLDVAGTNTYTVWVYPQWGDEVGNYTLRYLRKPGAGTEFAKHPVANPTFPSYDIADPVDLASGNYVYGVADVAIPSLGGGLTFRRTYNSAITTARYMGKGWSHNFDMYLAIGSGDAYAYYPDGHASYFRIEGGVYRPMPGVEDTLTLNGDGSYTLRTKDYRAFYFSSAGKMTGMADRNGNTTTLAYNGSGYLASVTVPGGRQLTFTTDGSGRITGITDPLGRTVSYTYTGSDLTGMTDIGGGNWTYAYGASGMTSMVDPLTHTTITNLYDSAARVREQVDANGGRWCFHFGSGSAYTSAACPSVSPAPNSSQVIVVDARGNKTTYEIDFEYRTKKVTDALGGVTETAYDAEHYATSITDPLGHSTAFTYDANGNVLTRRNALNNTWTYTYNAFNEVLTATDPLGHVVTNTYDLAGRLTSTQNGAGNTTSFTNTIEGLVTAVTDPRSNVTSHTYDAHGNQLTTTNPLGKVWTSTVDAAGRVLTVTDPLTHVTTNTWNNRDQLLTTTNHLTQTTTYTYDAKGNKKTLTDANSKVTTWNYDNLDRVSSIVDPASQTTSYVYDAKGNRTQVTNVRGKVTTYAYDALNRRTSETDPLSRTTSYTYDAASRLTQRTDARGLKTKYFYDNADRNTSIEYRTAADALVSTVAYAYDTANRRTSMTDLVGTTNYSYDNADRIASVGFPVTSSTFPADVLAKSPLVYWRMSETSGTSADDASSNNRDGTYDTGVTLGANGAVPSGTNKAISLDGSTSDKVTLAAGSGMPTGAQARSVGIWFKTSEAGLNRDGIFGFGTSTVTRGVFNLRRNDTSNNKLEWYSWADDLGFTLPNGKTVNDGQWHFVVVTYDGNVTVKLYLDGVASPDTKTLASPLATTNNTTYVGRTTHEPATPPERWRGELDEFFVLNSALTAQQVADLYAANNSGGTVSYQYDAASNRTRVTYPDAKQVNYTYDAANRMATVTDFQSKVTSYAYDDAGRLTTTTYPNGVVSTNTYDNADRLTNVTNAKAGTFSSFAYTLDAVGNRTQMVATGGGAGTHSYTLDNLYRVTSVTYPGPTTDTYTYDQLGNRLTKNATSYTYDNADQMTAAGGTSYTYDANGNQLTRGADTFTWDHENRLTQSVVGGVTSSSVYYGNGVRRSHTVNGVTTNYVYDVASSLPLVLQDGTNTLVYGLDLISSTDGAGNQTYYSYDGLGSTTDLTDGTGTVTDTYSYDVFGAVRARTGTNASPWKFTGEQEDGATGDSGYYFLRARYYDPATGRFISKDPIPFAQRYAYANGNPALVRDRSGLSCGIGEDSCGGGPVFAPGLPIPPGAFPHLVGAAGAGLIWAMTHAHPLSACYYDDCLGALGTWFAGDGDAQGESALRGTHGDERKAFRDVRRANPSIDEHEASNRLHRIKENWGYRGDVRFGKAGEVYHPNGEEMGNLNDPS